MKKALIAGSIVLLLMFSLFACRPGNDQSQTTPESGTAPREETTSPSPTEVPEITSAVEFFSTQGSGDELPVLDKEQSQRLLTAKDLTEITYEQSGRLPSVLTWDDVSVIDMYRYTAEYERSVWRAYYYYLEDRAVVIVNDAIRTLKDNKDYDRAWILVVPKDGGEKLENRIPPKGTVVGRADEEASLYEPYYNWVRNYFMSDPELPARAERIEPVYESYMTDFSEWRKWREAHPDYYKAWKELEYPEKPLKDDSTRYFRVDSLAWCESFGEEKITYTEDLPQVFQAVRQYGIPKEEMLEYVKWMNWSGAFDRLDLNEQDVEVLYAGDEETVRRQFLSVNARYLDGRLYSRYDILAWVPAYDVARMFTEEEFWAFAGVPDIEGVSGKGRADRLKNAWDVYDSISKDDAGVLDMKSAERVLSDFMAFYGEVRYSPDALAGDPASDLDPEFFTQTDYCSSLHLSKKTFPDIREEMNCIFTAELCGRLNDGGDAYETVFYSNQFSYLLQDGFPNPYLVSDMVRFYDGPIGLFDKNYKLEDHIVIDSSDETIANATLTAKNRSGSVESVYSVEFTKVGGRWLISGGTIFDLVEPEAGPKEWK